MLDRAEYHKEAALKLWERLVNIDSQTGDEAGLKQVAAIAIEELTALGASIDVAPSEPSAAATTWSQASPAAAKARCC